MQIRISPPISIGTGKNLVYLSNEELLALEKLKPILPDIRIMVDFGVFDFRSGRALIHRDGDGALRKIEVELTKWIK